MGNTAKIFLKPGKEAAVKRFHPWIFSGAIEKIDGDGDHQFARRTLHNDKLMLKCFIRDKHCVGVCDHCRLPAKTSLNLKSGSSSVSTVVIVDPSELESFSK